ncbi:DUF3970 family protein [Bacillus cereus group sp. Bce032]|uniref:DUF3970 family protein n=1 Tax=Bacillus cereus group sp. Bce032 TaxID=3445236 RepID=UPI003F26A1BE
MTKIRVMALPGRIDKVIKALETEFEIISVSEEYKNDRKGYSKEVRVYLEIEEK